MLSIIDIYRCPVTVIYRFYVDRFLFENSKKTNIKRSTIFDNCRRQRTTCGVAPLVIHGAAYGPLRVRLRWHGPGCGPGGVGPAFSRRPLQIDHVCVAHSLCVGYRWKLGNRRRPADVGPSALHPGKESRHDQRHALRSGQTLCRRHRPRRDARHRRHHRDGSHAGTESRGIRVSVSKNQIILERRGEKRRGCRTGGRDRQVDGHDGRRQGGGSERRRQICHQRDARRGVAAGDAESSVRRSGPQRRARPRGELVRGEQGADRGREHRQRKRDPAVERVNDANEWFQL